LELRNIVVGIFDRSERNRAVMEVFVELQSNTLMGTQKRTSFETCPFSPVGQTGRSLYDMAFGRMLVRA
jgi:hypothetical protein